MSNTVLGYLQAARRRIASDLVAFKQSFVCIPDDLRSFSWWQLLLAFAFACISIIFSFVNVNAVVYPELELDVSKLRSDEALGIEEWRRALLTLSGLASFTGVLCVVLANKGKLSCYSWGAVNCLLYGAYAFAYGYAGDAQLNIIFYLPLQVTGAGEWYRALDTTTKVTEPAPLRARGWALALAAAAVSAAVFYVEIPAFARALSGYYVFDPAWTAPEVGETPWRLDAVSNGLAVTAQLLMIARMPEQWVFWVGVDCIQVAMFSGVAGWAPDVNILTMWCLFLCNACIALYAWIQRRRDWRRVHTKQAAAGTTGVDVGVEVEVAPMQQHGKEEAAEAGGSAAVAVAVTVRVTAAAPAAESEQAEADEDPESLSPAATAIVSSGNSGSSSGGSSKRFQTGLLIGKFFPPHKGHCHLIATAAAACDTLTVIVCDRPSAREVPSGELRANWLRQLFPSQGVRILSQVDDEYDATDSMLWARLGIAWLGGVAPQAVFTSEAYGDAWAAAIRRLSGHGAGHGDSSSGSGQAAGCVHVSVDAARSVVPISGTAIKTACGCGPGMGPRRVLPLRLFRLLPLPVAQYYSRVVVLIGAESVGKSTLAARLAAHFNAQHAAAAAASSGDISDNNSGSNADGDGDGAAGGAAAAELVLEVGREVSEAKLAQRGDTLPLPQPADTTAAAAAAPRAAPEPLEWRTEEFVSIATAQAAAIAGAAGRAPLVVADTDALATAVWHERYMGLWSEEVAAVAANTAVQPALYLLPVVEGAPFVQDGTRDGGGLRPQDGIPWRQWMHDRFVAVLRSHAPNTPVVVLTGDWEQRWQQALAAVQQRLLS